MPISPPPVCHDLRGGVHDGFETPQNPMASRGSVGIHPCCKPSWYDHAGASTLPDVLELPIFHVQKK